MDKNGLVLQPRGGPDVKGSENFDKSVRNGVRLSDHAASLGQDLSVLRDLFPDGVARLWGSTPAASPNNPKALALRDRQVGDKVLFYADWCFFAEATILHRFHNHDAAKSVWGTENDEVDGATWEHIVALGDVREYETPVPAKNGLAPMGIPVPLRSITLIPPADNPGSEAILSRTRRRRHWLLQCNPATWDVWSWWNDRTMELERWTIVKHFADVQPGDGFAFWISGPVAGVYGLGTVTSAAQVTSEFDKYWKKSPPDEAKVIGLRFDNYLFDAPIPRSRLKSDPDFANSLIMRTPSGGNPFPLKLKEWRAISTATQVGGRSSHSSEDEVVVTSRPVSDAPTETTAVSQGTTRRVKYSEAALIKEYGKCRGRDLFCLTRRLPTGELLVCDVFDADENMIIEAKASTDRTNVRMAIGQLVDYRYHLKTDATVAILLPEEPPASVRDLIRAADMKVIYRDGTTFLGPE